MANQRTRVMALVAALVFLITSVGFSGLVLWDMWRQGDKPQASQQPASKPDQKQQANTTKEKENKLEGTKLKDFTPIAKVEKLEIIDLQPGTGEEAKPGATVKAHYTGALAKDGTIFQSSHDQPTDEPIEFSLTGVIKGWTDGVPGMKVGGKRRLIIPADQAYGGQEKPGIPANSDLVFDIELAAVTNQ